MSHTRVDTISPDMLKNVNAVLSNMWGCDFPSDRLRKLGMAITRTSNRAKIGDPERLCQKIISQTAGETVLEELATQLIPGETYFYRDKPCMQAIENELLPMLIEEKRNEQELILWSAGCSTGEEPFTLAMMLDDQRSQLTGWDIRILGSDLRKRALDHAQQGLYREWSFRGCDKIIKDKFFIQVPPDGYRVVAKLQRMVQFGQLNLLSGGLPPNFQRSKGFDLILCRNVFIYLAQEKIRLIMDRFWEQLRERGWLIVSAAEIHPTADPRFECVRMGSTFFYRKNPTRGV